MTEINNNTSVNRAALNSVNNTSFKGEAKQVAAEAGKEVRDLNSDPAAFCGKSQIRKADPEELLLKGPLAARLKADLQTFKGNPELVRKSDAVFERALAQTGDYAQAALAQEDFVREFKS